MNNRKLATTYYKRFSKIPGNQHIANLYAIEKILDILYIHKPKRILEIGLGIGSISYSILNYYDERNRLVEYYGTENNTFCIESLSINLDKYHSKLNIFSSVKDIKKFDYFDLVLIDGSDKSLKDIAKLITKNGLIFIEGDRKNQQNTITKLFKGRPRLVHTISNYKEPDYGPFITGNWSGGGKLIFVNPTLKQYLHWIFEKIVSGYRHRIIRN